MTSKKWKSFSFIITCFYPNNPTSLATKEYKQITSQRLSLSDVSFNIVNASPNLLTQLSTSLPFGSNLQNFSLQELTQITRNFSKSSCIGAGGFGPVYKGFIAHKSQLVAVKVLNLDGYTETLPWLTRIRIALGAAKGLAFLHEEEKPVIYRDFKPSNVLLDPDFNAKLSDFGLATDAPQGDDIHVTTSVMGTEGYAAPEYVNTGYLTTMSDVFSFGVVFLELLTGRKAMDKIFFQGRKKNLVEWASPYLKDKNKLHLIMDSRLEGKYSAEGARKAAALTLRCLSHHSKSRPTMRTVVNTMETVLSLTNDIPLGPFVYVVPTEEKSESGMEIGNNRGSRRQIKALRSRAVYSDTTLYKKFGS
ncbi:hypothetical protein ACFE04_003984 [Oxalis oulophora]